MDYQKNKKAPKKTLTYAAGAVTKLGPILGFENSPGTGNKKRL